MGTTEVFIAAAGERRSGLLRILSEFDMTIFAGTRTGLKANFNSDDPFPATTHADTLRILTESILAERPDHLTLAERSGMGVTRNILESLGVFALAGEAGFSVAVLDEIGRDCWREIRSPDIHWSRGFFLPEMILSADRIVQTCCLKTHRFGGIFTMSLKNSVGIAAKTVPGIGYDFMHELHRSPHQRRMIAEINSFYRTDLVIMDATEGFSSGGPEKGRLIQPGVLLGGTDRVAIDAAGISLLRTAGSTREVMKGRIFDLEQIARAAELGIGIQSARDIRLVPLDRLSEDTAETMQERLDADR